MSETTNQITGPEAIRQAMDRGVRPALLLVQRGPRPGVVEEVVERAVAAGVPIREQSAGDMRRMTATKGEPARVLALVGRDPEAGFDALLDGPGAVWLLSNVSYPSNVGTLIRSVEVAGAAGIVIDAEFNKAERRRSLRVAMRADRFLPVHWNDSLTTVAKSRAAGRRIVAIEDPGGSDTKPPWEVDLTGRVLLILGGERDGIAPQVLAASDAIVRLPMPGFVPSYNVQAAAAAVAMERLRQQSLTK